MPLRAAHIRKRRRLTDDGLKALGGVAVVERVARTGEAAGRRCGEVPAVGLRRPKVAGHTRRNARVVGCNAHHTQHHEPVNI